MPFLKKDVNGLTTVSDNQLTTVGARGPICVSGLGVASFTVRKASKIKTIYDKTEK